MTCAACLRFVHLSCARLSRYASSHLLSWECSTCNGVENSSRPITMDHTESPDAKTTLEAIFQSRSERRVLVRMSKSVRSAVADALASTMVVVWWWCRPHPVREHAQDLRPPLGARPASSMASTIDDTLSTGDDISWSRLLPFALVVLGVS